MLLFWFGPEQSRGKGNAINPNETFSPQRTINASKLTTYKAGCIDWFLLSIILLDRLFWATIVVFRGVLKCGQMTDYVLDVKALKARVWHCFRYRCRRRQERHLSRDMLLRLNTTRYVETLFWFSIRSAFRQIIDISWADLPGTVRLLYLDNRLCQTDGNEQGTYAILNPTFPHI